jgi:hypothetical protein
MGYGRRGVFWIGLACAKAIACSVYDSSLLDDEGGTPVGVGGTGGSASTGGTGGAPVSTGGSEPSGGTSGSGGAPGIGGISGTAGEGGTPDPGPPLPGPWLFPSDLEGWEVPYVSPLGLPVTTAHDAAVGDPALGSVSVSVGFDAVDQKVQLSIALPTEADLRGAAVTARIRLDGGLSSDIDNPGGAQIFVKTGDDYAYAKGLWTTLVPTGWRTVQFVIDSPAPPVAATYDPSRVREIGIEIATGSSGSSYQTANIHLDTVKLTR